MSGGCGCGGSSRSAERVPREQVARPGAGVPSRRIRTLGGDGTVWNGPPRPAEAAPTPEPEPVQQ